MDTKDERTYQKELERKLSICIIAAALGVAFFISFVITACLSETLESLWLPSLLIILSIVSFHVFIHTDIPDHPDSKETGSTKEEVTLKYYRCPACGAPLNSGTCEYCGNRYPVYRTLRYNS